MRKSIVLLVAALGLAGCSPAQDQSADAVNKAAAAKPKRAAYCFFKDEETKGWSVTVAANGDVTVKGRAHVKDPRYSAQMGTAEVTGAAARIAPTVGPNTTGFRSPDNWWDVSATIPGSAAVATVTVECGRKVLAELEVPRKG
jgi:hypothetical protein